MGFWILALNVVVVFDPSVLSSYLTVLSSYLTEQHHIYLIANTVSFIKMRVLLIILILFTGENCISAQRNETNKESVEPEYTLKPEKEEEPAQRFLEERGYTQYTSKAYLNNPSEMSYPMTRRPYQIPINDLSLDYHKLLEYLSQQHFPAGKQFLVDSNIIGYSSKCWFWNNFKNRIDYVVDAFFRSSGTLYWTSFDCGRLYSQAY